MNAMGWLFDKSKLSNYNPNVSLLLSDYYQSVKIKYNIIYYDAKEMVKKRNKNNWSNTFSSLLKKKHQFAS